MDYRRIYNQLCERSQARARHDGVFYERHHIKPRSFGGKKNKENMATLTLREHYIAHLLLIEIYPNSPAMYKAMWNMCNVTPKNNIGYKRHKPSARTFERIRGEYIKNCSGENAPGYGRLMTEEHKNLLRSINKGVQRRLGATLSEESKDKIRQKAINRKASESSLIKNRLANRGGKCYKAKKVICTTTGKEFGSGRELSEYTGIPFGTIRRWLNGSNEPPEWFSYKRVEDVDKIIEYKNKRKLRYDQRPEYKNTKEE